MMKEWVRHYNQGRPHMSLGPGIQADNANNNKESTIPQMRTQAQQGLPEHYQVRARPTLGGLHHESHLEKTAA
jgi:hypothetical protein